MLRIISVIDRYVLKELFAPFCLSGALFTFFLFIDRIYQLTDLVITKGVPFHLVSQLLVFMLPSFLALTLPMALLVAVLLAAGRMAGDLEVVAFQASGVGPMRLFSPVMAVALMVTLAAGALTIVLGPPANREFQAQLFKILQARATAGLKERVFNADFGDVIIYPQEISASQVALRGLLVSDERDPKLTRIITAREGRLISDEVNRRITLRLIDGAVNEADVLPVGSEPPNGAAPPRTDDAAGGAAAAGRYRYTVFGLYDMSLPLDARLRGAARFEKPEKDLTLLELEARIAQFAREPVRRIPFEIEWHKRFAFPLAAVVFTMVGFPLAMRSHRGGRSIALVGSLVIITLYYLLVTALEGSALRGRIPAWVAMWAPNAVFGVTGLCLLVMVARDIRFRSRRWLWAVLGRATGWWRRPGAERAAAATSARESTLIIDRYLVRSHVTFMLIGLAVAAVLFIVVDLAQTLDRFLRAKPPLAYILEHFAYRLPAWLHDGLPIVMLVATIFLFLTLTRYQELTALKAAGISLYRISAPIIAVGLTVAVGAGLFQEKVLPLINERGEEVDRVKIRGQLPRHMQSRARLWLRAGDTRFYRVELLAPGTADLYGVTILEVTPDFRLQSRLDARRAHWAGDAWELQDGAFREVTGTGTTIESVPFALSTINLDERIEDFTQIQKPVAAMSYAELSEYVKKLEGAGFHARKYMVELYAKLAFPLVNLIMVLVAIPFALQAPRSTRLFGVGLAIAIMVGYMVVHQAAVALARADLLPPLLAAWTANVIFLGLGLSLLARART
jgi:LPS export ABC transporter permease LptG